MKLKNKKTTGPKILVFDVETTPLEVFTWGIRDQFISDEDIIKDWSILSWSAKWLDSKKIMYMDTRKKKDPRDDKDVLKGIWNLLDEADVVLTQNGKRFDVKKLFSRFLQHGMQKPSSFQHIDTLAINRKHFAHTSNKLGYICRILKTDRQKLSHKKFPGNLMWRECLKGNQAAFREMELYNKYDVLSLEDVYKKLAPWDNSVNLNVYNDENKCSCGSTSLLKRGFRYTNTGKFQRYRCNKCGKEFSNSINLKAPTKTLLR